MNKNLFPVALITELRLISDLQIFELTSDKERFSRDFFSYSPILKKKLAGCCADLVVRPNSIEAVLLVAGLCHKYAIPLTLRGSGTGNYGQCVPLRGGVVMVMSGLRKIRNFDSKSGQITVEPGCLLRDLNDELIKKIVNEFKDIHFIIIRNSGKYFNESNVECYEWVDDMEEMYKKTIAVIRISTHDGQPGTIIETLSMGRHFIFSQEFPFCKNATNFEELKNAINNIFEKPTLNIEGSEYVNEKYSIEKISSGLEKIYKNI